MTKKIGIVGGGISGLATAFLLKKKGFEVTLFEKRERAGGNVETVDIAGFRVEYAPNSLLKSPRLVDLIRLLDLEKEVLPARAANKKRYVLRDGKLKALPMSVWKMVWSDYFSGRAKLRLLKEPFIKSKSDETESVAAFFERRLGGEIVARAADPFIAGIYAGSPEKLSVKAAFPRLFELEKKHGSLFFGALRSKAERADKDFPRTFSFEKGVQTLTDRLAEELGDSVKINAPVWSLERLSGGKWSVRTERSKRVFDALVIAMPAAPAADLVERLDAVLADRLRGIYYPPIAMVYFGVKKESVAHPLDGFGFLVPSAEKREILGTIWNSAVFENRAPAGYDLLTSFVGGARSPEVFEKSDEELFEIVFEELRGVLGLRAEPDFKHVKRWRKAIPQYLLGYEKTENAIREFENRYAGIYFCSNFYRGISMGDCVKNAFETAANIEEHLAANEHEQTPKLS
ncbi:MAG TPA: protoporphyrinogen oxidase [Pyrinomonadaceae bacterium]|jgi:oxygen-dependent protoporphyrinogen oxidase